MNLLLPRRVLQLSACRGRTAGSRGKILRSAFSSVKTEYPLIEPHRWDSIYTRLKEEEKSIRKPFYAIGRMPADSFGVIDAIVTPIVYDKPFWRARLFHPEMLGTGLVSGGYSKEEADVFYRNKYVQGAVGVAKYNSIYTQAGTFLEVFPGDEHEKAYYDFHFFNGRKYKPHADNAYEYGRRHGPHWESGDPNLRKGVPHSEVLAGEIFYDFDHHTNTATMQEIRAFIFSSWPVPLTDVDIKMVETNGMSSKSWDHWASDVLFDKDMIMIEFTLKDLHGHITRVPCFVLREVPRMPPFLAFKAKVSRFGKGVGGLFLGLGFFCGAFVLLDLIFNFV